MQKGSTGWVGTLYTAAVQQGEVGCGSRGVDRSAVREGNVGLDRFPRRSRHAAETG